MKHQTDFFNGPWHATSLQNYCKCGMQYLIKSQTPQTTTSLAMFKGSVIHRMLYMDTHPSPNTPFKAAARHEYDQLEHPLTENPDWPQFQDELEFLWRQVVEHLPQHEVEGREWTFKVHCGKYDLEGSVDAILQIDGQRVLVDWKNYSTLPSQFTLDTSLQLSIYDWAVSCYMPVDRIAWVHVQDYVPYKKTSYKDNLSRTESLAEWSADIRQTPTGKFAFGVGDLRGPGFHYTERSMDQRRELKREVARIIRGIKFNIFNRCENPLTCDCCSFQTECKAISVSTNIKVTRQEQQLIDKLLEDYDDQE